MAETENINRVHEPAFIRYSDRIVGAAALTAFFMLMLERTIFAGPWLPLLKNINTAILFLFLIDTVIRILLAPERSSYIKKHWIDLIVLIPLVQFVKGINNHEFYAVIRQFVIIAILMSRVRKTKHFIASLALKPAQMMVTTFFLTICAGGVILTIPAATVQGETTSLLDALFTSASAVCVTGLIVHDTATHFTAFGQLVILLLIQLGGLGIMTFSVFLAILTRKRVGIHHRIVMSSVMDRDELSGAVHTILFIFKMTLFLELAGAAALSLMWYGKIGSFTGSIYHGVFHAVSAFCNAGFSTFSDSLTGFASHTGTNAVVCLLIILGGLGFMVIRDIVDNMKSLLPGVSRSRPRLRIQTVIAISITVLLIITGSLGIFVFERGFAALDFHPKTSVLQAVFQSVSTRTAGFNTCEIASLAPATLFLMILLMFIGASPGSTGGGLKTTTFAVLWSTMMNGFSQNNNVEIMKRTIPNETIRKAITLLLFYLVLLFLIVTVLLLTENYPMADILFEAVSAVATVGLSTGVTGFLSDTGKLLIMLLMFFGRLGPLTIGYALIFYQRKTNYTYAEERIMIG